MNVKAIPEEVYRIACGKDGLGGAKGKPGRRAAAAERLRHLAGEDAKMAQALSFRAARRLAAAELLESDQPILTRRQRREAAEATDAK